jgi:hypothetical protein
MTTNHSVYDTISPARHVTRVVALQTMPQRGLSPLTLPGGTLRASTVELELKRTHSSMSEPTTHPAPRGGATASPAPSGGFTDLRFSPAQRKKGTYGDGYVTIGRGLMRNLYDAVGIDYHRVTCEAFWGGGRAGGPSWGGSAREAFWGGGELSALLLFRPSPWTHARLTAVGLL